MSDQRLLAFSDIHCDPLSGARRVADAPPDDETPISIIARRKAGGTEKALAAARATVVFGVRRHPYPGRAVRILAGSTAHCMIRY